MQITIKNFNVEMAVKNRGIEFEIHDASGDKHLGDLVLTKTRLIWCKGKTKPENGKKLTWEKFIEMMKDV